LGQTHNDAPAVVVVHDPPEQPKPGHAVDQFDGGVMPNEKESREIADGNGLRAGKAFDGKERLVLLRR
jgi:hypothetical protein